MYRRAVEIKHDFFAAYKNWGNALGNLGILKDDAKFFAESFQKFQRAIEINLGPFGVHYSRARRFAQQELARKACRSLKAAERYSPELSKLAHIDPDFARIRQSSTFQRWLRRKTRLRA